jgi:biopolymer transport protein ExbD
MRRRIVSRKHPEVELFPFLSILACTIGTLILLIIVLTTQTLNQQEVVIVAKEEEGGVNANKSPRYIETRSDGVILYPSEEFVPQEQLQEPNSPLQQLIAEVKANRDREYLIVALRPNAIDVFLQVRNILEEAQIDIGYEPLDAGWTLKTEEEVEIKDEIN